MTNRTSFLAAALQLCSTEDIADNILRSVRYVREAADMGAQLIALPENFAFLRINKDTAQPHIGLKHEIVSQMCALARELEVDLILGSIPEPSAIDGKVHNTSVYISAEGTITGVYRKMHLFDIDIPGRVSIKESDFITPGDTPVVVESRCGAVGLSICYDLRFPELYRRLTSLGAEILTCPAAFTLHTGKDHWLPLLRARAIENQSFVIAPGQYGKHGGERHSYGKSVIIDPWGIPLAIAADTEGFAMGRIDFEHQERIRAGLPCGEHRHPVFWPKTKVD